MTSGSKRHIKETLLSKKDTTITSEQKSDKPIDDLKLLLLISYAGGKHAIKYSRNAFLEIFCAELQSGHSNLYGACDSPANPSRTKGQSFGTTKCSFIHFPFLYILSLEESHLFDCFVWTRSI